MCAKGLDAGEGFLVGAEKREGAIVFTPERTAYFALDPGDAAEAQVRQLGIYTLQLEGQRFILGEDALRVARAMRRPQGVVLPFRSGAPDAMGQRVLATMLSAVLGAPQSRGETAVFTVHAPAADGEGRFQAAEEFWKRQIAALGYRPSTLPCGRAALLGGRGSGTPTDALAAGVGMVFGETAVDVCIHGESGVLDFSLLRGSDWIDSSVAKMKKVTLDDVRRVRETVMDLTAVEFADPLQGPLEIYIEHQIQYALQHVATQAAKAKIAGGAPLEVVVAGSGARVPGFAAKFERVLAKVKLPFAVAQVRMPSQPLQVPAGGALVKALVEAARTGEAKAAPAPGPQAASPAPLASPKRKTGKISDAFRTVTQKFQAPPQRPAPAPGSGPVAAAGPETAALLERIRKLEGRLADLEEEVQGPDHDMVENLRLAAGVGQEGAKAGARDFLPFFKLMVEREGSDLFLSGGAKPALRMDGKVRFIGKELLTQEFITGVMEALSGKSLRALFGNRKGVDLAIELKGIGRFRANLFQQRGRLAGVFRHIKERIPTFEELNLPSKTMMKLAAHQRGLILVTGVAGSGKSTTIASLVEHVNVSSNRHIVTVEDPIEYVFTEKQSIVDQREVGLDTPDFMTALRSAVRQSPDVIFIGEMRDRETMEASISAAETGHLVLSTLHTVNAQQTVERIITYFPPHQHNLIRLQLSMVLVGVLSVRLLPKKDGRGRVPAVEIMLSTPTIKDLLLTGKTKELNSAVSEDVHFGNQTFNESLKRLYQSGVIDLEEALSAADNPDELKLEIRGILRGSRAAEFNM